MAKEAAKLTPRQKKRRRAKENAKKRKIAEKQAQLERRARRNKNFGRGCFNKHRHDSVLSAFRAIHSSFKKKAPKRLSVYQCRSCKGYHITSGRFRTNKTYYVFTMTYEEWEELQKGRQA